jgi:hypothetical protein
MTTLTQLDKFAEKWFYKQIKRRGFAVEKKFYFWRKRGPLFDIFWSEIIGGGESLRIFVTIVSPWVDDPVDGEFVQFPVIDQLIGGTLSDRFPEVMFAGNMFKVKTEEDIEASLKQILVLIDERAVPWFNSVNSYETYLRYIGQRGFHPNPEYREKIKRGIDIGFEREPYG